MKKSITVLYPPTDTYLTKEVETALTWAAGKQLLDEKSLAKLKKKLNLSEEIEKLTASAYVIPADNTEISIVATQQRAGLLIALSGGSKPEYYMSSLLN